jgi:DNA ligase (NAD+)
MSLDGIKTKSAENILKSIEKSKTQPLWRLIAGLGIPNIGTENAQILADAFGTVEQLKKASLEDLKKTLTVADDPVISKEVFKILHDPEKQTFIHGTINNYRDDSLDVIIKKLKIKNIGKNRAKILADEFKSIEGLLNASFEDIKKLFSVKPDPIIPQNVYDYFHKNIQIVEDILNTGVAPAPPRKKVSNRFEGYTIVITGTLSRFSRQQIEQFIKDHGGKTSGSVSKKTSFVIAGEDAGSKLEKARKFGIEVISENEFEQRIDKPKKMDDLWS